MTVQTGSLFEDLRVLKVLLDWLLVPPDLVALPEFKARRVYRVLLDWPSGRRVYRGILGFRDRPGLLDRPESMVRQESRDRLEFRDRLEPRE
jgi:hypothetical protein